MATAEKLIKNKLGLLQLTSYLQNVSEACRIMDYSRDTFYRVKNAYEQGGIETLKEINIFLLDLTCINTSSRLDISLISDLFA